MLDKNLNQSQFNIQLEKTITRKFLSSSNSSLRTAVSDSTKCLTDSDQFSVSYPRDFRAIRALAIALWEFPEELKWRVWMDLDNCTFSWFNEKQKLELSVLLDSKELCYFYLYETTRYTARELFGHILGSDLAETLRLLRIKEVHKRRPVLPERHRGYRDKGSLRPSHRWLEKFDFSLTEEQNWKEKKLNFQQRTTDRLKQLLTRKLLEREGPTQDTDS